MCVLVCVWGLTEETRGKAAPAESLFTDTQMIEGLSQGLELYTCARVHTHTHSHVNTECASAQISRLFFSGVMTTSFQAFSTLIQCILYPNTSIST